MATRGPVWVVDEDEDATATNRLQNSMLEQVEKDIAEAEERNLRIKRMRMLRMLISSGFVLVYGVLSARIVLDLMDLHSQKDIREFFQLLTEPFLGLFGELLPTVHVINSWNKINLTHVAVILVLFVIHWTIMRLLRTFSAGK